MNRVLLVGRDPIFAWALEQKTAGLGFHVEHVYTLAEAKLRMNRFEYTAVLLDGLNTDEVDLLSNTCNPLSLLFVFDDSNLVQQNVSVNQKQKSGPFFVPKELAIAEVVSHLKM